MGNLILTGNNTSDSLDQGVGDLLSLPLVQASDNNETYLGFFNAPSNQEYGGIGLSIDTTNNVMFMQGLTQTVNFLRFTIPSLGGTATRTHGPTNVSGSVASTTEHGSGSIVYNGRLYTTARAIYDGNGDAQTHWIKAWTGPNTLSGQGTYCTMNAVNGSYVRTLVCGLAHVPTEWQELLGGPVMTLGCRQSIVTAACMGYGMATFDPATISTSGGAVTVNDLLNYTPSNPLEPYPPSSTYDAYPKNATGGTDLYSVANAFLGTAFIPSGSRSLLFLTVHGYGVADLGCRGGSSVNNSPFRVQIVAYDLQDLVDVKNGLLEPYEPQPYAWWELPGWDDIWGQCLGEENGNCGTGWATFDYTTNRLYCTPDAITPGNRPIHVWEIGTL